MRASEISLIISTYDRVDSLARVLRGVRLQSDPPGEIIIADDGSGSPTEELIKSWKKEATAPMRHFRPGRSGLSQDHHPQPMHRSGQGILRHSAGRRLRAALGKVYRRPRRRC